MEGHIVPDDLFYILAIAILLTAWALTRHFHQKRIVQMIADHAIEDRETFSYAFKAGWDAGAEYGQRTERLERMLAQMQPKED